MKLTFVLIDSIFHTYTWEYTGFGYGANIFCVVRSAISIEL